MQTGARQLKQTDRLLLSVAVRRVEEITWEYVSVVTFVLGQILQDAPG